MTEDVGFPYFNDIPLEKLINSALTKSGYQIITGHQNFENIVVGKYGFYFILQTILTYIYVPL